MNVIWEQHLPKKFIAALFILLAVFIAYFPGLNGPFAFDDEIHILHDPTVRITSLDFRSLTKVVSSENGFLSSRPLAKITLAINYYLSGGTASAFGYKLTNLVIHLVNTGLVYWIALLLFRQQPSHLKDLDKETSGWIPILVAGLWALHPLHLTTVLYVVQRMTSLAAFFVLTGLIVFIQGRIRIRENRGYGYLLMATGGFGGTVLGLACKENAVLLLPLMLVIEFIFFRTTSESRSDRRKLILFYGLTVLMPALILGLWLITHLNFIMDAYTAREFTPVERLLTESRVIWFYIGLLFLPDVRRLALYHDDIPISTGLFVPWTTLFAIVALFAVFILAIMARRRYPVFSFAVLWYLVGHSMESGIIGLEIAHEHRNYLPDIGILLASGYGLFVTARRFQKYIRYIIVLAPVITLGFVTNTLAYTWSSDESLIMSLTRHHPDSARSQYMLAEYYAEKEYDLRSALAHYRRAAELAPNETGYLVKSTITAARINPDYYRDTDSTSDHSRDTEIINHQLKGQPLTSSTIHILEQLTSCTDQASELCKLLYPEIKSWYLAVMQNPYVSSKDRGNFIVYLFNLGAARPDLDLSLQAAKWGENFEPSNPDYILMEANVYLLRGDLNSAEDVLQQMMAKNSTGELTNETRRNIAVLLREIESRKTRVPSKLDIQK